MGVPYVSRGFTHLLRFSWADYTYCGTGAMCGRLQYDATPTCLVCLVCARIEQRR